MKKSYAFLLEVADYNVEEANKLYEMEFGQIPPQLSPQEIQELGDQRIDPEPVQSQTAVRPVYLRWGELQPDLPSGRGGGYVRDDRSEVHVQVGESLSL